MFTYQEIIRSAQRKFAGFAWLSYDIDFRRKAAGNLSLNWGQRDTQLYLMKFTGQAKSCCSICGSGDHYSYGCSLSALGPNNTQRGLCNNYNRGTKCSQGPCTLISATAAKPATETTQLTTTMTPIKKLKAGLIRNRQTAEALQSMKLQTNEYSPLNRPP